MIQMIRIIRDAKVSIGIDPSFGSKFGIVATRFVNERIEVFKAEEYERPCLNQCWIVFGRLNSSTRLTITI